MTEEETEARKRADVAKEYRDGQIVVRWEPSYCIHVANCLRGHPGVFDAQARPWIRLDQGDADRIAEAIMTCPSGALSFERVDGGPQEEPPEETVVVPQPDGPLFVHGRLAIIREDGSVRATTRATLCRCGYSANKPFCDLTHLRAGFRSGEG